MFTSPSTRIDQSENYSSSGWGSQLTKSVMLAFSTVGFGYLVNKIWRGSDNQQVEESSDLSNRTSVISYQKKEGNSNLGFTYTPSQSQPEYKNLFKRVDIAFRGSQESISEESGLDKQKVSCSLGLALGGAASVLSSNPLPLAMGVFGCLPSGKGEIIREKFPQAAGNQPNVERSTQEIRQVTSCPITSSDDPRIVKITVPLQFAGADIVFTGIGNIKGDGQNAIVIAVPSATATGGTGVEGVAWVLFGGQDFSKVDLNNLQPSQGYKLNGLIPNGFFGYSITPIGNFNGNGKTAVAFGAPNLSGSNGRIYVALDLSGPIDFSTCDGSKCIVIDDSNIGICLSGGKDKDFNGDGFDDFVAGDPLNKRAIVFLGGPGPHSNFNLTAPLDPLKGVIVNNPTSSSFGCPIAMGKIQNVVRAAIAGQDGKIYTFNETQAGTSTFTTVANGQSGSNIILDGDLDQDGNTDIVMNYLDGSSVVQIKILYNGNPPNPPVDVNTLDGTNGGIGFQVPPAFSIAPTIASINVNGKSELSIAIPQYTPPSGGKGGLAILDGQAGGLPPGLNLLTTNSSLVTIITSPNSLENFAYGTTNFGRLTGGNSDYIGARSFIGSTGYVYIIPGDTSNCFEPTTPPTSTSNSNIALIAGVAGGVGGFLVIAGVTATIFMKVKGIGCFAPKQGSGKVADAQGVLQDI